VLKTVIFSLQVSLTDDFVADCPQKLNFHNTNCHHYFRHIGIFDKPLLGFLV